MAEQWAQSQGFKHFEVSSNSRAELEEAMAALPKYQEARKRDAYDIKAKTKADGEEKKNLRNSRGQQSNGSIGDRLKSAFGASKRAS